MTVKSVRSSPAALLLAACLAATATSPASAADAAWVKGYAGRSTNTLVWDKRTPDLIQAIAPSALAADVTQGLGGPPDPVLLDDGRYASASACQAHYCPLKALLWLDIRDARGLVAVWMDGTLRLGSRQYDAASLPAPARQGVRHWLAVHALKPAAVRFVGPGGADIALPASDWSPLGNSADLPPASSVKPP